MSGRIQNAFTRLKAKGQAGVIAYLTAGYPTLEGTASLIRAAIEGGAALIELGVPFSDPLADGATHQRSSAEALRQGTTLSHCLQVAREVRDVYEEVPLVLMGYYNTMLSYGLERLARDAAEAGVDGFIPVDLPPEEAGAFLNATRPKGLVLIFLVAPTSTDDRLEAIARAAGGFIYCVSLAGVTGARADLPDHLSSFLQRVRAHTPLPLAVGFGISRRDHVEAVARLAQAAVVGSALTDVIAHAEMKDAPRAVQEFIADLVGTQEGRK